MRQQQHDEAMDLMEEVDAELDDVRSLLGPQKNELKQSVSFQIVIPLCLPNAIVITVHAHPKDYGSFHR